MRYHHELYSVKNTQWQLWFHESEYQKVELVYMKFMSIIFHKMSDELDGVSFKSKINHILFSKKEKIFFLNWCLNQKQLGLYLLRGCGVLALRLSMKTLTQRINLIFNYVSLVQLDLKCRPGVVVLIVCGNSPWRKLISS